MAARIIRSPEERLMSAFFDKYSIIKRKDGTYLAKVNPLAGKGRWPVDGVFSTPWAALEFIRTERKEPDLAWTEVSMDEETQQEFEHPRH